MKLNGAMLFSDNDKFWKYFLLLLYLIFQDYLVEEGLIMFADMFSCTILMSTIFVSFFCNKLSLFICSICCYLLLFMLGSIDFLALVFVFVFLIMSYVLYLMNIKSNTSLINYFFWMCFVILCLTLFFHLVPGFYNVLVLDKVKAGPESSMFTMYINFDKPLVYFAIALACQKLFGSFELLKFNRTLTFIVLLFSFLPIASFLGYIKPEFHLPSWLLLFVINNLLVTCVVEESFFRGFIQQTLTNKLNWKVGLLVSSIAFSLVHLYGGAIFIIFAFFAGLCYGFIFKYTNRLWCAIMVHFLFNLTHLIFFTYPTRDAL